MCFKYVHIYVSVHLFIGLQLCTRLPGICFTTIDDPCTNSTAVELCTYTIHSACSFDHVRLYSRFVLRTVVASRGLFFNPL